MEPEVPPGGEEGAVEEQPERRPLDPETAARREAALEHVVRYGDPILRERAREVEAFDAALRADVERMVKLMDDALGVGLAATQIGMLRRVLVYRLPEGEARAVVNPVI
ncbi:MAG TPA: peptide deformylase, partial [Solirubrobacteraceae bacterium]|nr:peptide deformylase [Solirubrobacteraceae bacterium]